MMLILSACSGASETSQESHKKGGRDSNSDSAEYVLKVSHAYPTTTLHHQSLVWFSDELKRKSDGRLSLEIYPSSQLMPPGQEIQAIINGQVDMGIPISSVIGSIDPTWYLFELPYLFEFNNEDPSLYYKHKRAFFDSEKGGELLKKKSEKHGLKVLAMSQEDFSQLFTASKEKKITDVKSADGLKIRSTGGTILNDSIKALGASATVVDAAEVATSIQQGSIDGLVSTQYYAFANYPVKAGVAMPINNFTLAVMMSQKKFESLPEDLQTILVETGEEYGLYLDKVFSGNLKNNEETAKEKGINIYYPTVAEHNEYKKALLPLSEKWAKTVEGGQALLDEVENTRP